jgi:DNA-3-methyladenine glycosylase I
VFSAKFIDLSLMRLLPLLLWKTTSSAALITKDNKSLFFMGSMTTTRSRSSRRASTPLPAQDKTTKKAKLEKTEQGMTNGKWFSSFTKGDATYDAYMTNEWGFEQRGDIGLFEMLSLEGAQSGLSWLTILRKRQAYREAFCQFDPVRVAAMTDADVEGLLAADASPEHTVVRHRGKIQSVIHNAKCILEMRAESLVIDKQVFDEFLWSFVNEKPILRRRSFDSMPSKTPESEAMSKALKKRGFKFVGPTTCYSLMQSVGMVIDHPMGSPEWYAAYERLQSRPGGHHDETV